MKGFENETYKESIVDAQTGERHHRNHVDYVCYNGSDKCGSSPQFEKILDYDDDRDFLSLKVSIIS